MHDATHDAGLPPFEFTEMSGQVLIGTNACCETHFTEKLRSRGVDADISLESERIDRPFGVRTFLWLPTEDHAAPSHDNIVVGIATLDALVRQGRKTYIHCKNGHGRGPTFYAAYLILKEGMNVTEAVKTITQRRPTVHIEALQMTLLEELERERGAHDGHGDLPYSRKP